MDRNTLRSLNSLVPGTSDLIWNAMKDIWICTTSPGRYAFVEQDTISVVLILSVSIIDVQFQLVYSRFPSVSIPKCFLKYSISFSLRRTIAIRFSLDSAQLCKTPNGSSSGGYRLYVWSVASFFAVK